MSMSKLQACLPKHLQTLVRMTIYLLFMFINGLFWVSSGQTKHLPLHNQPHPPHAMRKARARRAGDVLSLLVAEVFCHRQTGQSHLGRAADRGSPDEDVPSASAARQSCAVGTGTVYQVRVWGMV